MDPLVFLGLAAFSAASFPAFAFWPRPSPRGQLEVMPTADDDPSTSALGKAAAPVPENVVTIAVVDNTPPPSGDTPLVRLTEMLRLRRRRG